MHHLFSRMTQRYTPPMDREVMEGLAVQSLSNIEEHLDLQFRFICQGMPECFKYEGYERCTSQEEFLEITRLRNNRRSFDLGQSYVNLVKLHFSYTDLLGTEHKLSRYVYLPFVTRGGIIMISGSKYHIVPVISDKVFTPSRESIFVRLTQDRNNIFRMYHTILVNGKRTTQNVVWATIYRSPDAKKTNPSKKMKTCLVHYLLGKYGFDEMFSRYVGHIPVVGNEHSINENTYPPSDWVICESQKKQPATSPEAHYKAPTTRIAVYKENWNKATEALVFGFFYVVDHFPQRLEPKQSYAEAIDDDGVISREKIELSAAEHQAKLKKYLNSVALWKILIGLIVFKELKSESILHKDISGHFETLDGYLDHDSRLKLQDKKIFLENYYDLLAHLSIYFNEMIQESSESGLSVYGKNLEITSYVLYDLLYDFTSMKFALNRSASRRALSLKDVTANLQQFVKMGKIFEIHSGKILTKPVSYSGDNLYPGITAVMAEQENRAGAGRGASKRTVVGPQHRIDVSMLDTGSVLNLPKSAPVPLSRINPWIVIDKSTGTILPNPKTKDLIDSNRKLFKL